MRFYGVGAAQAAQALETDAFAIREPENPHDRNAIAIVSDGLKLGHVDKRSAVLIAPMMDAGASCVVAPDRTRAVANRAIPLIIILKMPIAAVQCPEVCKGVHASAVVPPCANTISASRSLPIISSGLCLLPISKLLHDPK